MFWNMFALGDSFGGVPKRWRAAMNRVVDALDRLPAGAVAEPDMLAQAAGIKVPQAIALLGALQDEGRGRLAFRIVRDGIEYVPEHYETENAIPDSVENDFGDRLQIHPENIELIFEPRRP
jgi:hypothetical protein